MPYECLDCLDHKVGRHVYIVGRCIWDVNTTGVLLCLHKGQGHLAVLEQIKD